MAAAGGDNRRTSTWGTPSGRQFSNIEEERKEDIRESRDSSVSRRSSLGTRQGRTSLGSSISVTPPPGISKALDRSPSVTPPEAWGGEASERSGLRQPTISRFASAAGLPSSRFDSLATLAESKHPKSDIRSFDQDSSIPLRNGVAPVSDFEAATIAANKKLLSYEARDLNSSFSRSLPGAFAGDAVGSPKQRKSREDRAASSDGKKDFENGYVSRSDATGSAGASPPATNGHAQRAQSPLEQQQQQQQIGATGFALQLVQRGLEESLGAVQRAIHEEVQNLHLELLRQFHTQQVEMGSMMDSFLAKQEELVEEIKALRRENQQLRDLY
jgi:protein NEDD1